MKQRHLNIVMGGCFCMLWAALLLPVAHVEAGSGPKWACNDPLDCSSDCSLENLQVNAHRHNECWRFAAMKIQNYNKHKCKFTNNNNDNCPNETTKNCGVVRTASSYVSVGKANCTDSDYPTTPNDCNSGNNEDQTVQACD